MIFRPARRPTGQQSGNTQPADTVGNQEATITSTKPSNPNQYPFTRIRNPQNRSRCAIRVGTCPDSFIIGNPFDQSSRVQIKLLIDAGRRGMPSVRLDFRIPRAKPAGEMGDKKGETEEDHAFTVCWEPGLQFDGKFTMEDFQCRAVGGFVGKPFPQKLKDLSNNDTKKQNLYAFRFQSNGTKSSFYDEAWATHLEEGEQAVLRKIFTELQSDPLEILIWFVNPFAAPVILQNDCLAYLQDAARRHLPHLHQYKDEEGNPVVALSSSVPISLIGDGMYNNDTSAKSSTATGRPRYYNFPREVVWDSIKDFHIYQGVPLIRQAQFTQRSIGDFGKDVHHVFLQSAPYLKRGSPKSSVDRWITKSCFYAGVRITPNAGGIAQLVPDENSLMKFRFQEYPRVNHPADRADIWTGRVVHRSREWFATTQTDFCVMLTLPRHGDVPSRVYPQEQYCHNSQLEPATIELTYNTEAVVRELDAISKFCDDAFQPKLLAEIRQAFVSRPLPRTSQTGVDLSRGPQGRDCDRNAMAYQKYIDALRSQERTNSQQLAVLEVAKSMYPRLACVAGPPGTGKTRSLRQLVTGLRHSGHTFLVVAPSNLTVDNDATEIYHNLPDQWKKNTKMLRVGVGAQAMQAQSSHTDFEGLEHTDAGGYKVFEGAADSELMGDIQEFTVELAAFEDEHERLKQLGKDVDNVEELYRLFQASRRLKNSNVPVGMTVGYRIWEIMHEDRRVAEERYEALKATHTPERWADLANGPGISVNDYNPSHNYKKILDLYVEKDGKLSGHDMKTLHTLRWEMLTRVLRETHIIFTTCNTAGGPLLATGAFQPTIICCDDAAQANCPGLFVSMTSFTKWEGVFIFGDETQVQPIQLAASANEFIENSKLSAFQLLMLKDFPQVVRLHKQYRMAGAIASFPSRQFYDGELRNDSTVHRPDDVRNKVLAFTLEELEIEGPNGSGSEYVIVNVAYGIARQEKTGKSIVNHANADCMIEFLTALIGRGFDARTLKVLCYYRGQTRLMRTKIDEQVETEEDNGWTKKKKKQIEVSTVDAFHGKESDIVLLDFVAAKDNLLPNTTKASRDDEDEDQGLEEYVRHDRATVHVKDAHRLCIALTRARWGLFVFCQQALLERSLKMKKTKASNSVAFMINDARERNLIFNDKEHEDASEDGQAMLLQWNPFKLEQAREKQLTDDIEFAKKVRTEVRRVRNAPAIKEKVKYPVYKSGTRRTTRIIGSRVETDAADEVDSSYLMKSNVKG